MEHYRSVNEQQLPERLEMQTDLEKYWPMINDEESKFIEDNGGEYRGFVQKDNGRRQDFEDFRVKRIAYYDQSERAVVEFFVAADGMNDDGSELLGPNEVVGFKLMILRRRHDGKLGELGEPEIISLLPGDFPARKVAIEDLRQIAYEVQNLATENAPRLRSSALRRYLEEQLQDRGWHATHRENTI